MLSVCLHSGRFTSTIIIISVEGRSDMITHFLLLLTVGAIEAGTGSKYSNVTFGVKSYTAEEQQRMNELMQKATAGSPISYEDSLSQHPHKTLIQPKQQKIKRNRLSQFMKSHSKHKDKEKEAPQNSEKYNPLYAEEEDTPPAARRQRLSRTNDSNFVKKESSLQLNGAPRLSSDRDRYDVAFMY